MTNKEFAKRYLAAKLEEEARNEKFESGLSAIIDSFGYPIFESLPYSLYSLYDELVIEKIGPKNFEWITWFLYDSVSALNPHEPSPKRCKIYDVSFEFFATKESSEIFVDMFIED